MFTTVILSAKLVIAWQAKVKSIEEYVEENGIRTYNDTKSDWENFGTEGLTPTAFKFKDISEAAKDFINIDRDGTIKRQLEEIRQTKIKQLEEFYRILYANNAPDTFGQKNIWNKPLKGIDIVDHVQKNGITIPEISGRSYQGMVAFARGDKIYGIYPQREYDFYQAAVKNPMSRDDFLNTCGSYWEVDWNRIGANLFVDIATIAVLLMTVGPTIYFALKNVDTAKININLSKINWLNVSGNGTLYLWPSLETTTVATFELEADLTSLAAFQLAMIIDALGNGISNTPPGDGGGSGKVGDFSNLKGLSHKEIIERIPSNATRRELRKVDGGASEGFEYKWVQDGQTWRVRVHGPDPGAPDGSNAANGWVVRVQRGRQFIDSKGIFQQAKFTNPNGEFFNEIIMNDTHIPVQSK